MLTAAGRDFLPVLMMGAWAQRNRGVDPARFVDDTTGLEIEPIAVDAPSHEAD